MKIEDWFDPECYDHIVAFKHLSEKGVWPEGFIPEDVKLSPAWIVGILAKMANLWANHVIESGKISGF